MKSISGFRLGNFALFDGELQRIRTQAGLDSADYLDPLPVSEESFSQLGIEPTLENSHYTVYTFKTTKNDAIRVMFNHNPGFLVIEKRSRTVYPDLQWIHELQNLIEDKRSARSIVSSGLPMAQ